MRLTDAQLELQRQRPQRSELSLAIFQPQIALKCKINSPSIAKGAVSFNYNTVTFGSHLLVDPDMTVLVGTTEGSDDVGVIRLRSISASSISVAENSDIPWQDQLFITILRFVDIFAKFPRIIQNPSNAEDVIFYKDYDIPHVNQNNTLGALVNMGSHRYVEIENGTGTLYYSATGTVSLVGLTPTYSWHFEGGTPTGSTVQTPGLIRYNQAGDYVTKLVVTSPNGAVDTSYRYITARNPLGQGSYPTITQYRFSNLAGSRGEGGYSAEFQIYEPVTIRDGSVLILRSKDFYGANQTNLGGNYYGGEDIFFVGIVDGSTIQYNYNKSEVSFKVMSPASLMKRTTGFSISVESVSNSNKWYQLQDMTVSKAIYHFLKWHTTIMATTDVSFRGTDYPIQYYDADRGSLFDSFDTLLRGALIGTASSDRQGKLWLEVEPRAYPNPTGSFTPIMEFTKRDWRGEPNISENFYDVTSYIEAGGIAYSGAITGTFDAYLSGAPGNAPSNRGQIQSITGLALASQGHLNQLVGNLWANDNTQFPTISLNGANLLKNIDIAPYEVVQMNILANETARNKRIFGLYIPEGISWEYSSDDQLLIANDIEFRNLVTGRAGDTILIQTTPEDGYEFPDFDIPEFDVDLNVPELIDYDPTFLDKVIISIQNRGIFYTNDFSSLEPTWYPMNGGLPDTLNTINFEVSNIGRMYYQYGDESIWVAQQPGDVWTQLFIAEDGNPLDQVGTPEGFPFPRGRRVDGFAIDRHSPDHLVIFAGLIYTIFASVGVYMWEGTSSGVDLVTSTAINFDMAGSNRLLFGLRSGIDKWFVKYYDTTVTGRSYTLSETGVEVTDIPGELADSILVTQSYESNTNILGLFHLEKSIDGGTTFTNITGAPNKYQQADDDIFQSVITNKDGTVIVIGTTSATNVRGLVYSTNGGATFHTGGFMSGTNSVSSVWHVADDSYIITPIRDGLTSVLGINNLTTAPQVLDKTGNLRTLVTGTFIPMSIRHYWGS